MHLRSMTPCTTTGMHSLKMPPGSPAYRTGNEAPLNEIVKDGDAVGAHDRAFVDGPLQPDPSVVVAPVAHVDLVDVAVVVDGRCEELGHDDTAGNTTTARTRIGSQLRLRRLATAVPSTLCAV